MLKIMCYKWIMFAVSINTFYTLVHSSLDDVTVSCVAEKAKCTVNGNTIETEEKATIRLKYEIANSKFTKLDATFNENSIFSASTTEIIPDPNRDARFTFTNEDLLVNDKFTFLLIFKDITLVI